MKNKDLLKAVKMFGSPSYIYDASNIKNNIIEYIHDHKNALFSKQVS